jgi:hypothetical protein
VRDDFLPDNALTDAADGVSATICGTNVRQRR